MNIGVFLRCCLLFRNIDSMLLPGLEFPYVVAIMKNGDFKCAGINFDGSSILTAGHCVNKTEEYDIYASFPSTYANLPYSVFRVKTREIFFPQNYRDATFDYDIALITLNSSISLSVSSKPMARDFVNLYGNQFCHLMTWDLNDKYKAGVAIEIEVKKRMCETSTIYPTGKSIQGRKFCGRTVSCVNDTSGSTLSCEGAAIGMVVRSACDQDGRSTQFIFLDLRDAYQDILNLHNIAFNKTEFYYTDYSQGDQSEVTHLDDNNVPIFGISASIHHTLHLCPVILILFKLINTIIMEASI